MANKRIYYAVQEVTLSGNRVGGLQTVGISTNFNLEQVFEMGQLEIYQNIEEVPEVEVTLNKVLDGTLPIYILATEGGSVKDPLAIAEGASLAKRQKARTDLVLAIFDDSLENARGNALSAVSCPGMYVSSVSYTFPVDGNFTEDVTLVGNDKVWGAAAAGSHADANDNNSPGADSGVGRRQHLDMSACVFPSQIPTTASTVAGGGQIVTDLQNVSGDGFGIHFQNITVSCDLGRESINELGRFGPYTRYATFPVEVTAEFEVLSTLGDGINAAEEGYYTGSGGVVSVANGSELACDPKFNLLDQTIYLQTCEGLKLHLGFKNKLTSVSYQGGDTGGGNVTVTYSYSTYNDFNVGFNNAAGGYVSNFGSNMTAVDPFAV